MADETKNDSQVGQALDEMASSLVKVLQQSDPQLSLDDDKVLSEFSERVRSTLKEKRAEVVTQGAFPIQHDAPTQPPGEAVDQTMDFTHDDGTNVTAGQTAGKSTRVTNSTRQYGIGSDKVELPNNYEYVQTLGKGGMGVVYRARDRKLRRDVAIKMILSGKHASKTQLDRFRTEAHAIANLQHENVVSVYEVNEFQGMPYLALEFVDGTTLNTILTESALGSRNAAQLIEKLANAVDYIHSQGIIHRDLKPANIMLTAEGEPKVADFGLAKRIADDATQVGHTKTGEILGTPGYMSPEQARGEREVGAQADVYALGAILYYAMTARAPFVGPTPFDTIKQVVAVDPVPPSKLQPQLDKDLETICLKCLEKETSRRYQSAKELAEDLRAYLDNRPIQARAITSAERLWKWCKRNPRVATLSGIAASLLLALFLGGYAAAGVVLKQKEAEQTAKNEAIENEKKANKAQKLAKAAQTVAEANAREAEAARAEAVASEEVAEQQAKLALDTTRAVLYQSQRFFENRSELSELRKEMLDGILHEIERVYTRRIEYDVKAVFRASAIRQLGEVYSQAGATEKALEQFLESERIAKQSHANGKLPRPHLNLGNLSFWIANELKALGKREEALKRYQDALKHRQIYFDTHSSISTSAAEQSLALVHGRLGDLYQQMRRYDKAREHTDISVAARRKWLQEQPQRLDRMEDLAGALGRECSLYEATGEFEQMLETRREQIELLRQVNDRRNSDMPGKTNLALALSRHAKSCLTVRQYDEAIEYFDEATESFETLLAKHPSHGLIKNNAAHTFYCRGIVEDRLGRPSNKSFDRALELYEQYMKLSKRLAIEGQYLFCLARSGKHEQATEIADRYAQQNTADHQAYAGLAYGMLAMKVEDKSLSQDLSKRCIDQIRKFIRLGVDDFKMLRGETDFDFFELTSVPGYLEMLEEEQQSAAQHP